ncbi:MAG: substrate-binding domain-containing protein [Ignavibacteriales bacterium]|nr:substrate-binding domain-containing protein [Ignavibacteriales bacterium]
MKRNPSKILLLIPVLTVWFAGCKPEPKETPTKGKLNCLVDESLFNVVKDEKDIFTDLYKETNVELTTVKAREGIAAVFNGDAKMFVSSRNLNDEEKAFMKKSNSGVKVFKFSYDGLVLIVKNNESIDRIMIDDLKNLLLGVDKKYKITIPEQNSGVYEYLKNELLEGKEPVNVSIAQNENEVINKIKEGRSVIGIVGFNALKDFNEIKTLKIGIKENYSTGTTYYEPHPGYFVNGEYPLMRANVILINEIGLRVASGFTTFLTSTEGQKIVLKNNLGPAAVPVKLNQIN